MRHRLQTGAARLAGDLADRLSAGLSRWFRATGWWLPPVLVTALAVALLGCPSEPEQDTAAEPPPPETAGPGTVGEPVPPIPPAVGDEAGDAATPGMDAGGAAGEAAGKGTSAAGGAVARGRYLTERVAMCIVCHSPKDEHGEVIPERKFQGAPMPVEGPEGGPDWAVQVPAIAGMAFYTRNEAIRLLTEGIARDGEPPQRPMPRFQMTGGDASAVYDYLSSLPRKP